MQHPDSGVTEPAPLVWGKPLPLLWGEIHHTHGRVSEPRASSLTQWLKQTFRSWKSVFRRPGYLVADRGN